jgi:hypothetical protein
MSGNFSCEWMLEDIDLASRFCLLVLLEVDFADKQGIISGWLDDVPNLQDT